MTPRAISLTMRQRTFVMAGPTMMAECSACEWVGVTILPENGQIPLNTRTALVEAWALHVRDEHPEFTTEPDCDLPAAPA